MIEKGFVKIKKEGAKTTGTTSKPARLFTPYKAGAAAAPWLAGQTKALLEGLHTFHVGDMTVLIYLALHPDPETRRDVFRLAAAAREQPDTLFMAGHSDDWILSGNRRGRAFTVNGDISSCDASHYEFAFLLLHIAYSQLDEDGADALIKQAGLPFLAQNPGNEGEAFMISPHGDNRPFLGSGSCNTTILNSLVVMMCGLHMARCLADATDELDGDISLLLRAACAEVGYSVTVQPCERAGEFVPELMEFLKSFYDPRNDVAVTMPTAYLRNIFSRKGVVTAAAFGLDPTQYAVALSDPVRLMTRSASQIVNGLCHEPRHAVLDELRHRFNDKSAPAVDRDEKLITDDLGDAPACDVTEAIINRYQLSNVELDSIITVIAGIQPGCSVLDPAMTKMLHMDYGFPLGPTVPPWTRAVSQSATTVGERHRVQLANPLPMHGR